MRSPNQFLCQKITDDIIDKLSKNIENEDNNKAINRIIDNIKAILSFNEEELKSNIKNELERKNKENSELIKITNKEKKEKFLKSLNNDLNEYNNIINELIKDKEYNFDYQLKIKELLKLNEYLSGYNKLFINKKNIKNYKNILYLKEKTRYYYRKFIR